jgi:hypothetical protein
MLGNELVNIFRNASIGTTVIALFCSLYTFYTVYTVYTATFLNASAG